MVDFHKKPPPKKNPFIYSSHKYLLSDYYVPGNCASPFSLEMR